MNRLSINENDPDRTLLLDSFSEMGKKTPDLEFSRSGERIIILSSD
jgi:hypothetical protein